MDLEHLLQRRVFAESDEYELKRMSAGAVTKEDLTVFFIKEAIRLPMKYSSFQMMVSHGRVLHTYETREVMSMYETIAPNRAINKADVQYREWKKTIMDHLEERFGGYLRTVSGKKGEKRFVPAENSPGLIALATQCFSQFVPGQTPHVISKQCRKETPDDLNYNGPPDGEHQTEMLRFHCIVCPSCFGFLTKAWNLLPPDDSLAIPEFLSGFPAVPGNRFVPPALSDDDIDGALDEVQHEEESRRRISPATLAVVVDGQERCRLIAGASGSVFLDLRPTDEVVRVVDGDNGAVLVTHLPKFGDEGDVAVRSDYLVGALSFSFVDLPSGRLSISHSDVRQEVDEPACPPIPIFPLLFRSEQLHRPALHVWDFGCPNDLVFEPVDQSQSWKQTSVPWIEVLRAKIKEIDDLTYEQAVLYQKLTSVAHLPNTGTGRVRDTVATFALYGKGSLWVGAGSALVLGVAWSYHEPFVPFALAPFVTLSLLGWYHFSRGARTALRYFSLERSFRLLRTSLDSTGLVRRLARLRGMFDDADKVAFFVGCDQIFEGRSLAHILKKGGYRIRSVDSTSEIKDGIEAVVNSGGTILVYFVGRWNQFETFDDEWKSSPLLRSSSKDLSDLREFCFSRGSGTVVRAYQNLEEKDFAGGSWSFGAFCRARPSERPDEHACANRVISSLLAEALDGAASGPEGLVTASGVVDYIEGSRKCREAQSRAGVEIFHHVESEPDVLLMTRPPHELEEK